jgi:Putative peptidoglycan binding domain
MSSKDADTGVKILGGLAAVALLMALLSNGDPDNDAWSGGQAAEASEPSDSDEPAPGYDPWTAGAGESDGGEDAGAGLPACDGTALFSADGGAVRLPVAGPVAPFASPTCKLDGSGGAADAVRLVQDALARCNDRPVAVDGRYGPQTAAALRSVQQQHGIGVDGVYGPETRSVMGWPFEPGGDEEGCTADPAPG